MPVTVNDDVIQVTLETTEINVTLDTSPTLPVVVGIQGPQGPAGAGYLIEENFAYGDATPKTITTVTGGKTIFAVSIYITQAFNGVGASLKIGDSVVSDRLMATSENDPSLAGGYTANPTYKYGTDTQILLTINQGAGATQGAGVVLLQVEQ